MARFVGIIMVLVLASCRGTGQNQGSDTSGDHAYSNHLVNESSPYLLQHAHNPVDWYPWGDEALTKASEEGKMMVISVGYAACHWCHVMEDESFADTAVADIMNEHFVSVKVDREERPDVDKIYMDASYLMTGRGGWPLNVIALPDGRPVFAGTYFPKKDWLRILNHLVNQFEEDPQRLEEIASQIEQGMQAIETVELNTDAQQLTVEDLQPLHQAFFAEIDTLKGGRLGVQKFPTPSIWQYLLQHHFFYKDRASLQAVNKTLEAMARGGIYDHLGGGFARYSTDPDWRVPHFEKMLYDNSQLVSLYSKAYQLTGNPLFKSIVEETTGFIAREMTSEEGGFYSSYDADSEGEEGKFYVWTAEEIAAKLGDDAEHFMNYYSVRKGGNWENTNILMVHEEPEKIIKRSGLSAEEFYQKLDQGKQKLFEARTQRVYPGLDDKILTSWNALMAKGYLDAYRVFGNSQYLEAARTNLEFLLANAKDESGRLNRNYKDGRSSINAFLDDYSFLIEALIGLYEATFEEKWLQEARQLTNYTLEHFLDSETKMFYYTSDEDPELLTRKMELSDGAISSSNSTMARNLYLLGTYLYEENYLEIARQMVLNIQPTLAEQPIFYSNWLILMQQMTQPLYEVAIVGEDWEQRRNEFDRYYLPNVAYLGGSREGSLELLENKLVEGRTTIYVCENKSCRLPVTETDKALNLMEPRLVEGLVE